MRVSRVSAVARKLRGFEATGSYFLVKGGHFHNDGHLPQR
jgi:hypothetical protein